MTVPYRRLLFLLFLLFLFGPLKLPAQVLSFSSEDGIQVLHQQTNTEYVRNEGSGSELGEAPTFYIPIASSNNTPYLTKENLSAALISGNIARSVISIPVEISIPSDGQRWDAFAAAKKSGSEEYQVFYNRRGVTDGQNIDLTPDLNQICSIDGSLEFDCSAFQTGGNDKEEVTLFLAIGLQGEVDAPPGEDSIDPSNYADGIYIKLKLSSVISADTPQLVELYKGDGRLTVKYDLQGDNIEDGDSLYAYLEERDAIPEDSDCQNEDKASADTYATVLPLEDGQSKKLNTLANTGTATIRDLENGTCYSVQIYYRDKYGFASRISEGANASPELLEKLLQKNSCFLLTAGFGGDDPLIDDFRHFRDNTLQHSLVGRAWIRLYYTHAPSLAPAVAASPLLSRLVRAFAWAFHSLFLKKSP